jgi:hypothetical protein
MTIGRGREGFSIAQVAEGKLFVTAQPTAFRRGKRSG